MDIRQMPLGPLQTNCYIVSDKATGQCVIIDPGDGPEQVVAVIEAENIVPQYILNTHGHYDHIFGNNDVKDHFNVPLLAHRAALKFLEDPAFNLSVHYKYPYVSKRPDRLLEDRDIVTWGQHVFKVLFTPGHTPGGSCFLLHSTRFVPPLNKSAPS